MQLKECVTNNRLIDYCVNLSLSVMHAYQPSSHTSDTQQSQALPAIAIAALSSKQVLTIGC
jgi:hypothetical protein